jgi:putative ABC transport system ATP-binding protein
MSDDLVTLKDISRIYEKGKEKVEVLHQLNLTIKQGDFLALMGPSGSGKTTLLNLLGGLDKPTSGSVEIGGEKLHLMSSSALSRWRARHVGFIFQFYNLLPVLTAQKNVELPLLLTSLNGKERAKRAATALAIVGLEDRAKHYPRELSGGQEQRVAIARAIVSDPTLLLCDEPTGDLDRETADEILNLLQALNREHNKTIIMVTHDAQAAEYARHTLHMDKGTLVVEASA